MSKLQDHLQSLETDYGNRCETFEKETDPAKRDLIDFELRWTWDRIYAIRTLPTV